MADSAITYSLKGRLTFSRTGWVILEVPNSIGNGFFQALTEHGVEQPISETYGRYNAHVSVIRPDEVESIGGPDMIKARGQMIGFNTGTIREIANPGGWADVSKVWVLEIRSPELMTLRRSLGLGDPKYPFHMTFAIRKKNALKTAESLIHFEKAAMTTEIKPSPIEGQGLFATRDFEIGDTIVPKFMTKTVGADGRTKFDQSEQCRFTNHSSQPNCTIELDGDYVRLVADRDIVKGEELTGDYNACTSILGPDFDFTYRGKPYDGSSSTRGTPREPRIEVSEYIVSHLRGADSDESADRDDLQQRTDSDRPSGAAEGEEKPVGDHSSAAGDAPVGDHLAGAAEARSDRGDSSAASGGVRMDGVGGSDDPGRRDQGDQVKRASAVLQRVAGGTVHAAGCTPAGQWLLSAIGVDAQGSAQSAGGGLVKQGGDSAGGVLTAVNRNQVDWSDRLKKLHKRRGECPGCGQTFKEDEPYPDVEMCEVCERYGPPKDLVKAGADLATQIASARKDTAEPTEAQARAGNYAKGKFRMHGMVFTIETPKGGVRSGTSKDGKKWSNTMTADYGYINGTIASDEDHIDVFVGPDPESEVVFVVDQIDQDTGKFDEIKVMFGYTNEAAAIEGYLSNYSKGWKVGEVTPLTVRQFKWWVANGDTSVEICGAKIKTAADSIYMNALQQTPISYDPQAGILANIGNHLGAVKARGDRTIAEAGAQERPWNAMDPNRSMQQTLAFMRGQRKPLVSHPIDRILAGAQ